MLESLVAPAYHGRQLAWFGGAPVGPRRLRVGAALVLALGVRAGLLAPPLLAALVAHRVGAGRWIEPLVLVGLGVMHPIGRILTLFASRAALLDGSPREALRRARIAWPSLLVAYLLLAGWAGALASRIPALVVLAVVLRWSSDVVVSRAWMAPTFRSPAPSGARVRRTAIAAFIVVVVGACGAPRTAAAGDLVSPAAVAAPASTDAATTTGNPTADTGKETATPGDKLVTPTDLKLTPTEVRKQKFDEANLALADAQALRDKTQQDVIATQKELGGYFFSLPSQELLDKYKSQLGADKDAAKLVGERRQAVDDTGNAILSDAYGGQYGTLARNWIDIKNTPSFLVGMAESTPAGIVGTVKAVGTSAYDLVTGTKAAEPDAATVKEQRLLSVQQELDHELLRIRDGATANRIDGNWYGENVIGPVVAGEVGALAVEGAAAKAATLVKKGPPVVRTAEGEIAGTKLVEECSGSACIGASSCFAPETLVATPAGPRAIVDIRDGDEVLARDPETGETRIEHVVTTFVHVSPVVDLELEDDAGKHEHLTVTPTHPFHVTTGAFRPVAMLAPGDHVDTVSGTARVVALQSLDRIETVYNFEVENAHTYFVGTTNAWVHNACSVTPGTPAAAAVDAANEAALTPGSAFSNKVTNGITAEPITPGVAPAGEARRLIGGHSYEGVLKDPNVTVLSNTANADGTMTVKFTRNLTPGEATTVLSKPKTSTIAPASWKEADIVAAGRQTALTTPVKVRPQDGASLFVSKVNGVEWAVIKDGSGTVTSSFPTGGRAVPF